MHTHSPLTIHVTPPEKEKTAMSDAMSRVCVMREKHLWILSSHGRELPTRAALEDDGGDSSSGSLSTSLGLSRPRFRDVGGDSVMVESDTMLLLSLALLLQAASTAEATDVAIMVVAAFVVSLPCSVGPTREFHRTR